MGVVPVSSNTTQQFPAIATTMALPGVRTFQCVLFEGEDLWHHRLFGTHMRSRMFIWNLGLTAPTDLPFTSALVGSRWFALDDTAGFTTGDAFIIELGGVAEACGMRVLVGRGSITFAAASSGLAPIQVVASDSDVRTLPVRLDPRGERACAFADAVHFIKEHSLDDFSNPIAAAETLASSGALVETSNGAFIIGSWS